jgi:hypothetical protein
MTCRIKKGDGNLITSHHPIIDRKSVALELELLAADAVFGDDKDLDGVALSLLLVAF